MSWCPCSVNRSPHGLSTGAHGLSTSPPMVCQLVPMLCQLVPPWSVSLFYMCSTNMFESSQRTTDRTDIKTRCSDTALKIHNCLVDVLQTLRRFTQSLLWNVLRHRWSESYQRATKSRAILQEAQLFYSSHSQGMGYLISE